MNIYKQPLYAALLILFLGACSSVEQPGDLPTVCPSDLSVRVSPQLARNASSSSVYPIDKSFRLSINTNWTSATPGSFAYSSVEMKYTGDSWNAISNADSQPFPLYWASYDNQVEVMAWSPATKQADESARTLPLKADSETDVLYYYKSGSPAAVLSKEGTLPIIFNHAMSLFNVNLTVKNETAPEGTAYRVTINGLASEGTFDCTTGTVTASDAGGSSFASVATTGNDAGKYSCYLVPQSVAASTLRITVSTYAADGNVIPGQSYTYTHPEAFDLTSGSAYTIGLTVVKGKIELSAPVAITPWENEQQTIEQEDIEITASVESGDLPRSSTRSEVGTTPYEGTTLGLFAVPTDVVDWTAGDAYTQINMKMYRDVSSGESWQSNQPVAKWRSQSTEYDVIAYAPFAGTDRDVNTRTLELDLTGQTADNVVEKDLLYRHMTVVPGHTTISSDNEVLLDASRKLPVTLRHRLCKLRLVLQLSGGVATETNPVTSFTITGLRYKAGFVLKDNLLTIDESAPGRAIALYPVSYAAPSVEGATAEAVYECIALPQEIVEGNILMINVATNVSGTSDFFTASWQAPARTFTENMCYTLTLKAGDATNSTRSSATTSWSAHRWTEITNH